MDQFAAQLLGFDIVLIAGIESLIFRFSTLFASQLNIGSMVVRKKKQDTELETRALIQDEDIRISDKKCDRPHFGVMNFNQIYHR